MPNFISEDDSGCPGYRYSNRSAQYRERQRLPVLRIQNRCRVLYLDRKQRGGVEWKTETRSMSSCKSTWTNRRWGFPPPDREWSSAFFRNFSRRNRRVWHCTSASNRNRWQRCMKRCGRPALRWKKSPDCSSRCSGTARSRRKSRAGLLLFHHAAARGHRGNAWRPGYAPVLAGFVHLHGRGIRQGL